MIATMMKQIIAQGEASGRSINTGLEKYFNTMKARIEKEDTYQKRVKVFKEDQQAAVDRAEARSALQGERLALNTRKRRSTWRDVKFRSRQDNKVFDIKNKTMDNELNKAEFFLSKGRHSTKTALEK